RDFSEADVVKLMRIDPPNQASGEECKRNAEIHLRQETGDQIEGYVEKKADSEEAVQKAREGDAERRSARAKSRDDPQVAVGASLIESGQVKQAQRKELASSGGKRDLGGMGDSGKIMSKQIEENPESQG